MKIIDCFIETMAFTTYLTKNCPHQSFAYDSVADKYNELIASSRHMIIDDEYLISKWDNALFAICAWVDEQILFSEWEFKDLWQKNTLQKQYFKTTQAGERFFAIFDNLDENEDRMLIEVYNYCIKLGFQGKNFNNEQPVTKVQEPKEFSDFTDCNIIFPESYKDDFLRHSRYRGVNLRGMLITTAIIVLIALGLLDFTYKSILDSLVSGYFK